MFTQEEFLAGKLKDFDRHELVERGANIVWAETFSPNALLDLASVTEMRRIPERFRIYPRKGVMSFDHEIHRIVGAYRNDGHPGFIYEKQPVGNGYKVVRKLPRNYGLDVGTLEEFRDTFVELKELGIVRKRLRYLGQQATK